MKNLAGVWDCDNTIKEELLIAGIDIHRERSNGEVPYSLVGKLGEFKFKRAWYYWMVSGVAVPFDAAVEMYENEYGKRDIRCHGNAGCPHPKDSAIPTDEAITNLELENVYYRDIYKMYEEGKITAPRFVFNYHIDSQIGLKIFVDTIKKYKLV